MTASTIFTCLGQYQPFKLSVAQGLFKIVSLSRMKETDWRDSKISKLWHYGTPNSAVMGEGYNLVKTFLTKATWVSNHGDISEEELHQLKTIAVNETINVHTLVSQQEEIPRAVKPSVQQ